MIGQVMWVIRRDFIAGHLHSQVSEFQNILDSIEEENEADRGYASKSLKDIEIKLRQPRKLCVN